MRYIILIFIFTSSLLNSAYSQKKKKKSDLDNLTAKELFSKIKLDSTVFLNSSGNLACKCIDSVYQANKSRKANDKQVLDCIDQQVSTYQLSLKLLASMQGDEKNKTITLTTNKDSREYENHYYQLERWLKDSCPTLNYMLKSHDEEEMKSISSNIDAVREYDKGVELLKQSNYAKALPFFEKAVKIDSIFAFAWDNIGVCSRNLGNYEKAEKAYKESLKLEPSGKTALQNIAVVYSFQKKYDDAIQAYKNILDFYPDDAEVYYGIGSVYFFNLKNNEKGLDNMCKAYNIYVKDKSPYRADAEKVINYIYTEMKKDKKEDLFNKILKENNISPN